MNKYFGSRAGSLEEAARKVHDEDTADFIGAASKAAAAGKKEFKFGGKTYPVTIKKDVAKKVSSKMDEQSVADIMGDKNYSMREALAKIWDVDKGYDYFAAEQKGSVDESKMKQLKSYIDDVATAMKADKNMKPFVTAFVKDAMKSMNPKKSLEKVLPDYIPGKDVAKLLNMGEEKPAAKTVTGQTATKVLINPEV